MGRLLGHVVRAEEVRVREDDQQLGGVGGCRGHEGGCLHTAWPLQAEDEDEAGDEGWRARGVRQGRHGEGEARTQDCKGLPCQSPQGQHLSRHGRGTCLKPSLLSVGVLRGGWVSRQDAAEACECWPLPAQPLYLLAEPRTSKK